MSYSPDRHPTPVNRSSNCYKIMRWNCRNSIFFRLSPSKTDMATSSKRFRWSGYICGVSPGPNFHDWNSAELDKPQCILEQFLHLIVSGSVCLTTKPKFPFPATLVTLEPSSLIPFIVRPTNIAVGNLKKKSAPFPQSRLRFSATSVVLSSQLNCM